MEIFYVCLPADEKTQISIVEIALSQVTQLMSYQSRINPVSCVNKAYKLPHHILSLITSKIRHLNKIQSDSSSKRVQTGQLRMLNDFQV